VQNNFKKYTATFLLISLPFLAIASFSPPDSLKHPLNPHDSLKRWYFLDHEFNTRVKHIVDTSFYRFHEYNPLSKEDPFFYQYLGNAGTAAKTLLFEPECTIGFNYQYDAYDCYLFNIDKIKYYQLKKPFTDISYVMGTGKEQLLKVVHSQNITKTWNAALDFRLIDSPGSYYKQETYHTLFTFCTDYFTKNKKYGIVANFIYNKVIVSENGGVAADSLFENNLESRRIAIPVFLEQAENRVRNWGIYIRQYYQFKFRDNDTIKKHKSLNFGKLMHTFHLEKKSMAFKDNNPNALYYLNVFNGKDKTYDSIHITGITNGLFWLSPDIGNENAYLKIKAGSYYNYHELYRGIGKEKYSELIPALEFETGITRNFFIRTTFDYAACGYIKNDFSAGESLNKKFSDRKKREYFLIAGIKYTRKSPYLFDEYLYASNFRWNNTFSKQDIFSANLMFECNFLKVKVIYNDIFHYIFLNNNSLPEQYPAHLRVVGAYINKIFNFWKFGWDTRLLYQHAFSDQVIHLPALVINSSLYIRLDLFKKALNTCFGIEVFYNTPYYADNYMPAIRDFYIQDKTKTGNFIYGDIFLDLKIKRARLFVKVQNINEGLFGYNYYLTPHYPLQDRSFKFGVSWMFND